MSRAFLFVLDSFGIGGAVDAAAYRDEGADTFGHIAEFCAAGAADREGLRSGPLHLPHMVSLGLMEAAKLATGHYPPGMDRPDKLYGIYGCANEVSRGKDTPSGHWEVAGVPVMFDWGYFPTEGEAFPASLVEALCRAGDIPGILGNCHASGTQIISALGSEHMQTGKPICYTSADSVFQIAAHEQSFGLDRLIRLSQIARTLLEPYNIGRVIARPFVGNATEGFSRTANRRDFSVPPPEPTLLDRLTDAGRSVHAIGKIGDIFAHRGISQLSKADGNMALMDRSLDAMNKAQDGDLVFTNFIDFDMLYGHRRDVAGYAAALEAFDARLPDVARKMKAGDIMILTADHGCDPTWRGTDHTRERVPILAFSPGHPARSVGVRSTYADIGETIAAHLGLPQGPHGRSFLA